jgi:uncharacterized glyoxalase superfamily protein PhnB
MSQLIVNIDAPDQDEAERFYAAAFGFEPVRRLFGGRIAEMRFAGVLFHILGKPGGAAFENGPARAYARHWTPLHLDLVVDDIDAALARALKAGAVLERPLARYDWGAIAGLADPFGHGWCLIALTPAGYDAAAG